jgi:hypothetical protein
MFFPVHRQVAKLPALEPVFAGLAVSHGIDDWFSANHPDLFRLRGGAVSKVEPRPELWQLVESHDKRRGWIVRQLDRKLARHCLSIRMAVAADARPSQVRGAGLRPGVHPEVEPQPVLSPASEDEAA